MANNNPEHPADYGEYIEVCYDVEKGETTMDYETWKATRPNPDDMLDCVAYSIHCLKKGRL